MKFTEAIVALEKFSGKDLTRTLSQIELSIQGSTIDSCGSVLARHHAAMMYWLRQDS